MALEMAYVAVGIVALLILGVLVYITKKKRNEKLSPIAGLAFAFVISGIVFGKDRFVGYLLMGAGIILSLIDIYLKEKK